MIVKMKKYVFLVYHKQYTTFLEQLRDVGVLHVAEKPEGIAENDQLREKMQLAAKIKKTITEAETSILPDTIPHEVSPYDGANLLDTFDALQAEKTRLQQLIDNTKKEAERMRTWGNFSTERLEKLNKEGFVIQFFSCTERKFNPEWETTYHAFEIDKVGTNIYFVTVNPEAITLDAEPVTLNERNYDQLLQDIEAQKLLLVAHQAKIEAWVLHNINNLKHYFLTVEEHIDFQKVELNTEVAAEEKVMLLEGFCPEGSEEKLNTLLNDLGIYYEVFDPTTDENIPIKLKNNFFAKLFEPITKMFDLPNYSELDPTPFFAPFFMLFFGLCLGDGGYGLLIFVVATLLKKKLKPELKSFATLAQWLSATTMVVGLVTGSFFGIALDSVTWPWLAEVKQYFVTGNNYKVKLGGQEYEPMMVFSVIIGLVQIFFGMGVNVAKVIKQHGIKHSLAPIAWIVGLLGSAITFGLPKAGITLPTALNYIFLGLIGISLLLIVFYNSPDKYKNPLTGVLSNIGAFLWDTFGMVTGLIGDTLSYIRLFALGLTGSILGGVFNTLAFELTSNMNPFVGWIVTLFILLAGHAINFGLSLIGALVHPMRLTFVEFYKNAGFEGGGKAYEPFKNRL
ncbi:MAG TPA: V-type ATPase 116kDa subunit family protein [Paludibacteraceae bacterium]|nr:V-type ATPase 116kDa subunit family protein [Paludibacteraceae bacterium]HRS67140.1 V-type ATPase 116kDa subunit family protein [Paludibacteraceae bacterium]